MMYEVGTSCVEPISAHPLLALPSLRAVVDVGRLTEIGVAEHTVLPNSRRLMDSPQYFAVLNKSRLLSPPLAQYGIMKERYRFIYCYLDLA